MRNSGHGQLDEATRRVFAPRAKGPLTHEDVRQIAENLTGFFRVLREWADAEKEQPAVAAAGAAPETTATNGGLRSHGRPKSQGGQA